MGRGSQKLDKTERSKGEEGSREEKAAGKQKKKRKERVSPGRSLKL